MADVSTRSSKAVWVLDAGLTLGLGLLTAAIFLTYASGVDEFTRVLDGFRLAAGEVPYRDFFDYIPPGTMVLAALGSLVGGKHLLMPRLLMVVMVWASALQLTHLARGRGVAGLWSWLPALVLVVVVLPLWPNFSQHLAAMPFQLGTVELALAGLAAPGLGPWLASGVAVGLTGLMVQTNGACTALAVGMGVLAAARGDAAARPLVGKRLAALAAGTGLVLLPVAAWLAWQGALGLAWYDLVTWPARFYRQPGGFNDVAFATDLGATLGAPSAGPSGYARVCVAVAMTALAPGAALAALAWLAGWLRRPGDAGTAPDRAGLAMLGTWVVLAFGLTLRSRADFTHVCFASLPALLLATIAAWRLARAAVPGELRALRWLPLAGLCGVVACGAVLLGLHLRARPQLWVSPARPDGHATSDPAVRFLQAHGRPGDRLAAVPHGSMYYIYGLPPFNGTNVVVPTWAGYGAPDEFKAYWEQVALKRPRFILLAPWFGAGRTRADYQQALPPRYHLAADVNRTLIYEADEAKP